MAGEAQGAGKSAGGEAEAAMATAASFAENGLFVTLAVWETGVPLAVWDCRATEPRPWPSSFSRTTARRGPKKSLPRRSRGSPSTAVKSWRQRVPFSEKCLRQTVCRLSGRAHERFMLACRGSSFGRAVLVPLFRECSPTVNSDINRFFRGMKS